MGSFGIDRVFERRLASLVNGGEPQLLQGGRKGVEKESLRVTPQGRLAQTPHPRALGSALTNEHITTDYSEALIELVTPAFTTSWELLQYLLDLHQFVYRHLGDELLWATSMPGAIESNADIPIAQYGTSHVGRMKTIYRRGLGLRYGRMMQAISGVHFNYSFPLPFWEAYAHVRQSRERGTDFISACYFDLLRNYRRFGWIVLYLYGVSPVVCKSFLKGRDFQLADLLPAEAFATPDDVVALVDEKCGGEIANAELGANGTCLLIAAQQNPVIHPVTLASASNFEHLILRRGVAFVVDADHFQSIPAITILQRIQILDGH